MDFSGYTFRDRSTVQYWMLKGKYISLHSGMQKPSILYISHLR